MTDEYHFLLELESLTAEVYKAKKIDVLSYKEISQKFSITPSFAYSLVDRATRLLKYGDFTWMTGLSNRAINQLLKTKYKDAASLKYDVLHGNIDLEDLPQVGHKIAQEIYKWCLSDY